MMTSFGTPFDDDDAMTVVSRFRELRGSSDLTGLVIGQVANYFNLHEEEIKEILRFARDELGEEW